jgi:putative Holliday junction resolvase
LTGSSGSGRVLAIDLGQARLGLAVSDPLGITAQPLGTVERSASPRIDLARIAALVAEREVTTVVVGLPLQMSGKEGLQAAGAREFAARLAARLARGVDVRLWDERLTTVEAERLLVAADVRRSRRKHVVDTVAAVLILQSFLDARSAGHAERP